MPTTPIYEIDFHRFSADQRGALKEITQRAEELRLTQGPRAAALSLTNEIGITLSYGRDASQYNEALDYTLALSYALLDEPELAEAIITRMRLLPSYGGNMLFSDHVATAFDLFDRQTAAKRRGIPSILLASMPRSASAYFTHTLSAALDIPVMRLSLLGTSGYWLMLQWLNGFTPGGAISHDHFGANAFNISRLIASQVRDVFVLMRDPRPAAVSAALMGNGKELFDSNATGFFHRAKTILDEYSQWADDWLKAEADATNTFKVHILMSSDVRLDTAKTVNHIFAQLNFEHPVSKIPSVVANFNHGDDQRWRQSIPLDIQEKWWDQLTPAVISRLDLSA
jgi:hypothetical protein